MSAELGEFDEFDVTEDQFDAMTANARPVEIVADVATWLLTPPPDLYTIVTEPPQTYSLSKTRAAVLELEQPTSRTTVVIQEELALR